MNHSEDTFRYTYSAKEQSEVARIRSKYMPTEESKLERLRRLDRGATQKAQTWAITLGVIGALVMGTGMSLIMTELAAVLGIPADIAVLIGILAGIIGIVLVALAYPVYNRILKKERQRIAPEILRLTDELMK